MGLALTRTCVNCACAPGTSAFATNYCAAYINFVLVALLCGLGGLLMFVIPSPAAALAVGLVFICAAVCLFVWVFAEAAMNVVCPRIE
jgi:hypothetical protein